MALPGPAVVPVVPHSRAKNPVAKSLAFFHQHMEKSCDLCNREVGNFCSAFAGFAGERLGDLDQFDEFRPVTVAILAPASLRELGDVIMIELA